MQLAKESGVDHVLLSTAPSEVNVKKIMDLTGGEGVRVVYDGVGKDTFEEDFVVVRRLGTLALFGNASVSADSLVPFGRETYGADFFMSQGPPPMMSPLKLSPKSLKMSRPKLDPMIETHEEFCSFASHIVKLVEGGHLKVSSLSARHNIRGYGADNFGSGSSRYTKSIPSRRKASRRLRLTLHRGGRQASWSSRWLRVSDWGAEFLSALIISVLLRSRGMARGRRMHGGFGRLHDC